MGNPTDRSPTGKGPGANLGGSAVDVIDRYQIVARLGKGGMAEVFRAKLQSIGGFERDVALKVLLPNFASEPEFVEMLLDEARIAGAIDHPNVLQVLDVGRRAEIFYLVMEYVDGKDLRSIAKSIPGGRIPLGMALHVVSEVLRGLDAVHTATDERGQPRNIVHRDISPGNVMIERRGFVKLGDFGIAHASGRITRTRVGAVKGKSRYMAPEQLAGTLVDHRADLYAVGVTLFEAILGDFARGSSRPTIYGPMFTWPDRLPDGAVPADVEAILRRAITETPELRYRDAVEFRDDLELALHRWAPGYNSDTLARELKRLGADMAVAGNPPDPDSTRPVSKEEPVGVRPGKWRGVATAEHELPLDGTIPTGTSASALTPVQRLGELTPSVTAPAAHRTGSLSGLATGNSPVIDAEPRGRAVSLDHFGHAQQSRLERVLDRRLGWGVLIGALALVTVVVVYMVAGMGSASLPPVEEPHVVPAPASAAPRSVPLPTLGAVDVRGPAGAEVIISGTSYGVAPVRIELPPGEYVVQTRGGSGKKHRTTSRAAHVVAGRTTPVK